MLARVKVDRLLCLAAWLLCGVLASSAARAQTPSGTVAGGDPLCRFGIDLYEAIPATDFDLAGMGAGWYIDYAVAGGAHVTGFDYAPVVQIREVGEDSYALDPPLAGIAAAAAANPGAAWMIGNEPDRRMLQDDLMPALYAHAYHDLYEFIKGKDPTARLFAGNIVQPTALRMRYLDLVLDAYQTRYGAPLPVDGWSVHNFILNERSCAVYPDDCWGAEIPPGVAASEGEVLTFADNARIDLFVPRIPAFRRWMAARGYRDRPLYLTEFGVLMPPHYGYPPQVVNAFMNAAFAYLQTATDPELGYLPDGNRLVQRFAWYAVIEPRFNGGLFRSADESKPFSPPFVRSEIGDNYAAYTAAITRTVDLAALAFTTDPPAPPGSGAPFTATLALRAGNSGDRLAPSAAIVRFYDGAPGQGGIEIGTAQTIALSGCGDSGTVNTRWSQIPPNGARSGLVYAQITLASDGDPVQDLVLANNLIRIPYFVAAEWLYLPLVR